MEDRSRRWEALFADLAAQHAAAEDAEFDAEVRERTLIEFSRLAAPDRLRAAVGRPVTVCSRGGGPVRGELVRVGADWLLLADGSGEVVVPLGAVRWVAGLGPPAGQAASGAARLGFGHALRELLRARTPVTVVDVDGTPHCGTVDMVGADFVEVAGRLIPFAAVGVVRSA